VRVLITGASGQLGRALVESAPGALTVIACSRSELDITDLSAVSTCIDRHGPAVIINAAGYTAVDQAESEHRLAFRINADGPRNLAQAAWDARARLIHISTDYVFDGNACAPYRPEAQTNPLNVYGATKRAGEIAVSSVSLHCSVILRSAWLYAAQGRNFLRTMLQLMRQNGHVRVVADQVGTPTAAVSLAFALWRIVENPQITGVHHWTDMGVASWYDFASAIAEDGAAMGLLSSDVVVEPVATSEYPTSACRPRYSVLDTSSLRSLAMKPVHWRTRLRTVLGEIGRA
jgi:dTDP-4-dehydrorhamnose reductase